MVIDGSVVSQNVCFVSSIVPIERMHECIVLLYKGKGDKWECTSFRGMSLLSVTGKVYDEELTNQRGYKGNICDDQGGFRRQRRCMD